MDYCYRHSVPGRRIPIQRFPEFSAISDIREWNVCTCCPFWFQSGVIIYIYISGIFSCFSFNGKKKGAYILLCLQGSKRSGVVSPAHKASLCRQISMEHHLSRQPLFEVQIFQTVISRCLVEPEMCKSGLMQLRWNEREHGHFASNASDLRRDTCGNRQTMLSDFRCFTVLYKHTHTCLLVSRSYLVVFKKERPRQQRTFTVFALPEPC